MPKNIESRRDLAVLAGTLALALGVASTRSADACTLNGYHNEVLAYWSRGPAFNHQDERCDNPGDCRLQGWLVAPKTGTLMPGIIFEHGSAGTSTEDDQSLDLYCELINTFVNKGYVVFMPFRRGVVDITTLAMVSPVDPVTHVRPPVPGRGFHNTGWAVADWAALMANANPGPDQFVSYTLSYIEDEANDINDAINTLIGLRRGTLALVGSWRVSIMGHSMGGALATMAAGTPYDNPPQAVVNLSGAAMSWHESDKYPTEQVAFADGRLYPTLYTRVLNESWDGITPPGPNGPVAPDFESATSQFHSASPIEARIKLYDPITLTQSELDFCRNTLAIPDYWCVHSNFVTNPNYVPIWTPRVLQFLGNHNGIPN